MAMQPKSHIGPGLGPHLQPWHADKARPDMSPRRSLHQDSTSAERQGTAGGERGSRGALPTAKASSYVGGERLGCGTARRGRS